MPTAKILIIEDNVRVSTLLKRGLESQDYSIYISEDAEDAWPILNRINIDLIITDVMLPGMDGLQLTKKVREKGFTIPILILTALGTMDEKLEGFKVGADDYLVKPFEIRELYARVNALLQRAAFVPKKIENLEYDDLKIELKEKNVYRNEQLIVLTPKEYNLLLFLLKNSERVLSREEIADSVWGKDFDTGTNYIDVYITYLRKKIDRNFDKKLIHTKPGLGYTLSNKL